VSRPRQIAFGVVAVLGALFLLEGAARLAVWWQGDSWDAYAGSPVLMDRVLHHRLRPSESRYNGRGGFFDHTNAQGWTERHDVARIKAQDVYRIFYVGDSQVNALVAPGDKMADIVEEKLARRYAGTGRRIEVVNTGTSSYSTMIYYLLVKHELLEYSPDLVVINVDMTDVPNDYSYQAAAVIDRSGTLVALDPKAQPFVTMTPFGPVERSRAEWLRAIIGQHSALARFVDEAVRGLLPAPPPPKLRDVARQVKDRSADWLSWEWTPEIESNVAVSMRYLGMTIDLLHEHGVRVVVTGVPHHSQFTGVASHRPHAVLAATAARHGAAYLDSYEALRPSVAHTAADLFYWSFDPTHFNRAGNALWARVQLAFLVRNAAELLPPRGPAAIAPFAHSR
jgi:hypothetical protein